MRKLMLFLAAIAALIVLCAPYGTPAHAGITIRVNVAAQTMHVSVDGTLVHEWRVSTAKRGAVTPRGTYRPYWLSEHHRSSLYNWAPMPNAVFYSGNFAIHGTRDEHLIGTPASRGCVRLTVADSKTLFALVRSRMHETVIVIE